MYNIEPDCAFIKVCTVHTALTLYPSLAIISFCFNCRNAAGFVTASPIISTAVSAALSEVESKSKPAVLVVSNFFCPLARALEKKMKFIMLDQRNTSRTLVEKVLPEVVLFSWRYRIPS